MSSLTEVWDREWSWKHVVIVNWDVFDKDALIWEFDPDVRMKICEVYVGKYKRLEISRWRYSEGYVHLSFRFT